MNFKILSEQAAQTIYRRALGDELESGKSSLADLDKIRINHPLILRYKASLLGNRDDFKVYADWTDFLAESYPRRRRTLSLGSGLGRVEHHLIQVGFCNEVETIELCAEINEAARLKHNQLDVQPGDLNFVSLPENRYDFIICHGVLHHLINLEHVLGEINKALTPDGLLLIYEYVGETRWQFSAERQSFLMKCFPRARFAFPQRWSITGFEAVRSGELLQLINLIFGQRCERSVLYGGVYFPFVVSTDDSTDQFLPEVLEWDAKVSAKGHLPPCYLMGVYRKTHIQPPQAEVWSDDEVEANLAPKAPLTFALGRRLKKTGIWAVARNLKNSVLQWRDEN